MIKTNEYRLSQKVIADLSRETGHVVSKLVGSNGFEELDISTKTRKYYNIDTAQAIIKSLRTNKLNPTHKIHTFYNFKGGTGKTTLCYQMSCHLAILGFKVLVIDCDPQAHLTSCFGYENSNTPSIYDVLINNTPIKQSILEIHPRFDLIPANLSLTRAEVSMSHETNRETMLKKAIAPIEGYYDFILIDANPTISVLNRNAIYASDHLHLICETQPFSIRGLEMLVDEIKKFTVAMGSRIEYTIIPNKFDPVTITSQEALGEIRTKYKDQTCEAIIRRCEDFNISAKRKAPLACFSKSTSTALEDIVYLLDVFIDRFTTTTVVNEKVA